MTNQRNNLFIFLIGVLTVLAIIVVWPQVPANYFGGLPLPGSDGIHIDMFNFHRQGFRLGLDLQGGTHLVLLADTSKMPSGENVDDAVAGVTNVIERRIDSFGVSEAHVQRQGTDRIIVELPGIKNIEEAKNLIGKTAQLDFREQKTTGTGADAKTDWVVATATGSDGTEKELTGQYFKKASVGFERGSNKPEIQFQFDSEGGKLMGEITKRLLHKPLGIFLDGQPISTPTVNAQITTDGVIQGNFTLDEARDLVIQLNAGALPLPVSVVEERTVDATLGADSVRRSVVAGEIALFVVAAFMIAYYRMLGVVAVGALFVYTLLTLSIFKLWPITLTLAGIAGFILSIGMAVDANILIFERMKEELRSGKTVGASIDAGFSRAWPSIRDSNFSTLITCGILFWFGSNFGAQIVMGFAVTLAIGVAVSMFSAIVITRSFLRVVVGRRAVLHPGLFGMPTPRQPQLETAGLRG